MVLGDRAQLGGCKIEVLFAACHIQMITD